MAKRPHNRRFDWIAFLLLCVMILLAAWALAATEWTEYLNLIPLIGLVAVWAGAALGYSRFPAWFAVPTAAIYGFFLTGWQLGGTLDPALPWRFRAEIVYGRLAVFVSKLIVGEPNEDSFIFVILMAVLFWVIGIWSAWNVFRRSAAWPAILSIGISLLAFTYFYYGDSRLSLFLGVFSLAALILASRMEITARLQEWAAQRARVPLDVLSRVSITGLVAAILIIGLAWGGPAFAKSENLSEAWYTLTHPLESLREGFDNAFNPIEGPTRVVPTEYGETLTLTAGTQPFDRLVMTVDPSSFPTRGGRFYWRSRVYDLYEQYQWSGPTGSLENLDPRQGQWSLGPYVGREEIEVIFAPQGAAIKLLYLPTQPIWVDRSSEVSLLRYDDGTIDVLRIEADRFIREGEVYHAIASIASPSAEQLRNAGEIYPEWVLDRYLQLPDTVTLRTKVLAEQITEGLETPYDKAVAITRWLRDNIEYSRVTNPPPLERDPIDWFLFDYKVGFCNFYASAEAVLLRSLGIPARMAAGYARGEYLASEGVYEVRAEDSHSWPEVFFPGIGWVEFEPTVSQPLLSRPEVLDEGGGDRVGGVQPGPDAADAIDPDQRLEGLLDPDETVAELSQLRNRQLIIRIVGSSLLAVSLLLAAWIRINPGTWAGVKLRLGRISQRVGFDLPPALEVQDWEWDTPTGRIYAAWSAWLRRLGLSQGPWETAHERANQFANALPESAASGWRLVNAYVAERFVGEQPDLDEVRGTWRELQSQLWLAWMWKLTNRWRREA